MMMMMIRAMSVQALVMPNDRASADVPCHMDRDNVKAPTAELLNYRIFARLFPGPPGGGPYFDQTLTYKFRAFFTMVTFEIALCFWILFRFLTYLICFSCRGPRSWHSWRPSHGPCKRLDTHRGPKSPAKASTLLLVGVTFVIFMEHNMNQLNPPALPWRPEGSEPATGFGGANKQLAWIPPEKW